MESKGNITVLGAARLRQEGAGVEATVAVYPDGLAALVSACENPGNADSRAFFVRLGSAAARRLYINAAKAGYLDE